MPNSPGSPESGPLPRLTLGQRLLAALPSLQRDRPDAGTRGPATTGGGSAARRDGAPRAQPAAGAARPDPYTDMSVAELRHAMKYLDERERALPLFIGPLLAVLDVVLTIVALHSNPAAGHKGHVAPQDILALGIGSAAVALVVVVVAAFFRRRSFTIFALLFAGYGGGFLTGGAFLTMVPSWFVAGWLFVRFNRMQKSLVSKTGGPAAARQRAGRAGADRPARPLFGRKEKAPQPPGPAPNKRYTPPKPVAGGR